MTPPTFTLRTGYDGRGTGGWIATCEVCGRHEHHPCAADAIAAVTTHHEAQHCEVPA